MNAKHHINIVVAFHLVQNGIAPSYKTWLHHGEHVFGNQENVSNESRCDKRKGVGDDTIEGEREDEDDLPNLLHEDYMATIMNDAELNEDAHQQLYPGCKFTLLSFVIKLLHVKVLNKWNNKSFDALLGVLKELLPISDGEIPGSIYEEKKFLRELGYVPIDACKHPADGEAWKDFDRQYLGFAKEARNVRLGLATDVFNPFGNMSTSYSMWPVVVVPYNLPPWKCMIWRI
ncbi:hypothetical protein Vadar_016693 [Vaccinium darrowii]|uniref:Uncharacterized protein n=1 Tax=Vaccinium darrowii TaxID=229202 RepID=A0ACB7Z4B5_9ERIC|nr:hypothetical protein Vadar_016693 [Vaccinium darrowii]